jgi:hypothetical protein
MARIESMPQNTLTFRQKQMRGVVGALCGAITAALVLIDAAHLFPYAWLPTDEEPARLLFALKWLLVPGICLLVGVHGAARRGFFAEALDGTRTPASHSLEINLRYNQNTLEQLVLAAIAWIGLAIVAPIAQLMLIPAMATLFGIGRIAFWVGYLITPIDRAFGMVLTALPTLGTLLWLVWHYTIG